MARKFYSGIDLNAQRLVNMADPSSAQDAATKQYVDNVARGLAWKPAVRVASTANLTVASAVVNAAVVDGVTLATGDRILLKNQTTASENGIYIVAASGAASRAPDFAAGFVTASAAMTVEEGTANGDKVFMLTTDGAITVGTTSLVFSALGGGTSYLAGNGITLTGSTFSVTASTGISVGGGGVAIDTTVVTRKFSANVGNGSLTTITLNHNLGTQDVEVQVWDATSFATIECDVVRTDANNVALTFPTAPTTSQFRATVQG